MSGHVRLALLYLLCVLPSACWLAWRMPPFQGPDEDNQFLRAVQVAQGGLLAARLPGGVVGGSLPQGAERLAHGFGDLRFQPRVRIGAARLAQAGTVGWGPPAPSGFANTAIYPPVFYLPSAAGILVARASHGGVLAGLRLARLANATCAIAIGALAIGIAGRGRLFLFWLLCLPMSQSLFASCSQDALLIAGAALLASLLSRAGVGPASRPGWALLAAAFGCLGAARAPYLMLALLPAVRAGGHGRIAALIVIAGIVGLGWLLLGAAPVMVPNTAAQQAHFLLGHPWAVPHIAWATLQRHGVRLLVEFIGVLGWLDVTLPRPFAPVALLLLAALLVAEGIGGRRDRLAAATVLLLPACGAAIALALDLDWTPVGDGAVEGLQGRYFIPPAAFIALLLGRHDCRGTGPACCCRAGHSPATRPRSRRCRRTTSSSPADRPRASRRRCGSRVRPAPA